LGDELNRGCPQHEAGATLQAEVESKTGGPSRREAMTMLPDVVVSEREAIHAACRQYGARRIRVFGSVARGEERLDSDIGFLVDFPRGYDLFAQRLPLAERLAEITGRRLDLIPEHELNRHLPDTVLKEAVDLRARRDMPMLNIFSMPSRKFGVFSSVAI
jgi:uncharacterized protein